MPTKGGRLYEVVRSIDEQGAKKPDNYAVLEPLLVREGYLTSASIRQALGIDRRQATRVADALVKLGWLRPEGDKRGRRYYSAR